MKLTLKDLAISHGDEWILRDGSLTAESGSILGICGVNGSGRTSLLNAIAGALRIRGGEIDLDGSPLSQEDLVILSDRKSDQWIWPFGKRQLKYSSSEIRLKKIERILKSEKKVVLLDEPFASLDPDHRHQLASQLREIKERSIIIFTSSNFGEILEVADEAALLSNGYIEQTGSPRSIYDSPISIGAAKLTGKVNLIEARRLSSSTTDVPEYMTLVGEHRLFAANSEKERLGAINKSVSLLIRPEKVVMSMGASFPEDNLLRAVVTSISYLGPTSTITFDANGLSLSATVFSVVGLIVGDECMLGLPPDRMIVLKS